MLRYRSLHRRDLGDNTEAGANRWMVSYADFITLLFAFFVVMYSISSVNDGKFRVLSDAMVTEFNVLSHRPVPIDLGGTPVPVLDDENDGLVDEITPVKQSFEDEIRPFDLDADAPLAERVQAAVEPFINDDNVIVRDGQTWLEVELPSELLFNSGRANISESADTVIERMAKSLRGVKTPIRVEGFTDNVPITGGTYGSNWQLSAARAAALVNEFSSMGIEPTMMSAIGFGEYHPIADNGNEAGRRKNRRVVVAVAKHESVIRGGPARDDRVAEESVPLRNIQRVTKLPGPIGLL